MDDVTRLESLFAPAEPDWGYRPRLFDLSDAGARRALVRFVEDHGEVNCCDAIRDQLSDLASMRLASSELSEAELDRWIALELSGRSLWEYGVAVYYPWLGRLVHLLPRADFEAVRATRNRYKITEPEQERLARMRIGVVGVSAGYWAATTMALEGIGGEFRLADFDRISLSNTNRLSCGVTALAVNKAVQAARRMFEIDPFLTIEVLEAGLSVDNDAAFFTGSGQLDLVVEECDDLATKVRVREIARRLGIPVVMETNDRGMLDIERFDREPERPIFHGLVGALDTAALDGLTTKEKLPFVLALLGDRISERVAASMFEINESISGWPQLASDTTLGGALVASTARRVLLGQLEGSGRYYVDLHEIISGTASLADGDAQASSSSGAEAVSSAVTAPRPARGAGPDLTSQEVRTLVAAAAAAPSGGNCQPWGFAWRRGVLDCIHELERSASFLDYHHLATYLAFGAAIENLVLAGQGLGLAAELDYFPRPRDPTLVCRLEFSRDDQVTSPELLEQVFARVTNRQLGQRSPASPLDLAALTAAAGDAEVEVQFLTAAAELDELGAIMGEIDRFRFFSKQMHQEFMAELRWNQRQAEESRDGIDVATLELGAVDAAGLRLLASWPVVELLRRTRQGKALEHMSKRAVEAASAVGQLAVTGTDALAYVRGGRAMQRVWLTASARGLAFQPIASAPYLFARLEAGGDGYSSKEARWLAELRSRYARLFRVSPERGELVVFRIAKAPPPSAVALRRTVDEMLVFE